MNGAATRPAKDTPRAGAQRERILCAAQRCFIDSGFHAASMASIADTAQMSAGLMYRYFENKSAIVLAIIERQLQEGRTQIAQLRSSSELAAALLDVFTRWQARDPGVVNAALFLEMSAEASRDPQIAAALRRSDALILSDLAAWMNRDRDRRRPRAAARNRRDPRVPAGVLHPRPRRHRGPPARHGYPDDKGLDRRRR